MAQAGACGGIGLSLPFAARRQKRYKVTMTSSSADPAAFRPHDHARCRGQGLAKAREICAERGLRLTPARAFALETLLESHRAMTAYELLDRLREAGLGGQPPVAYRALDFLVEHGFAHRIERLGAFVACARPDQARVTGRDHTGAEVAYAGDGLLARCLQHETDHTHGTVFGDRLSAKARKRLRRQMESEAEDYPEGWPAAG